MRHYPPQKWCATGTEKGGDGLNAAYCSILSRGIVCSSSKHNLSFLLFGKLQLELTLILRSLVIRVCNHCNIRDVRFAHHKVAIEHPGYARFHVRPLLEQIK